MNDSENTSLAAQLKGIGPKTLERLNKLNITELTSLLFHLPARYEDKTKISPIRSLRVGTYAAVVGVITSSEAAYRRQPILHCLLTDLTGSLQLSFFHFAKLRLQFKLTAGTRLYCYGEIRWVGNKIGMTHPEYKILAPGEAPPIANTLTAIYPTTAGLSQNVIRKLIDQAINIAKDKKTLELFPDELLKKLNFPNLIAALNFVHQPPPLSTTSLLDRDHPMRKRLIFEELLAEQLSLLKLRREAKNHHSYKLDWNTKFAADFLAQLPFKLTNAQLKVLGEIELDLKNSEPMLRLLQGDVGCGKTIVAAFAIAQAVINGYQAAIMAPTDLLAQQHFKNISSWLEPFGIKTTLLNGKIIGKKRALIETYLADNTVQVAIGTHALFQENIKFHNLALVVIDEQHRFGVHQRLELRNKGKKESYLPHQLIMTATPIPRTLAMAIYADLDCSVIDELPLGRSPIDTIVISNTRRTEVLTHLYASCKKGKQAYWVCPLIAESEHLQFQAAETLFNDLTKLLPDLKVALIHGRLPHEEKEQVMKDFLAHKIDLLVATTVIEVGVDVANASLMIIENAERLGLVQLHQLRGRVGRGKEKSFCVLLYQPPLLPQAKKRLLLLRDTNDGFFLAKKDLEMRGIGEVLGTRQSGSLQLKIADLMLDKKLIPEVQQLALTLLQKYPKIADSIIIRWIGTKEQYGQIG